MTEKKTRSYTTKKANQSKTDFDTVIVSPNDVILANSEWLEGIVQYLFRQQGRCGHCGEYGHTIKDCKERNANS